jgi:hypothetical protein
MTTMRRWRVEIFVDELDGTTTRAEARLLTNDRTHLTGRGEARRNPADAGVPEIGDEIAAGRALLALARLLLREAEGDVAAVTGEDVDLGE